MPQVLAAGATDVRRLVRPEVLRAFLRIYNDALSDVFIMAIPLTVLALVCALPMEWRSLRKGKPASTGEEK